MDKEYRTPQNPQEAPEAPADHSGNLPDAMREKPVTNFKDTPLSQFENIQLGNIPESPATLPDNMPPLVTSDDSPLSESSINSERSAPKRRRAGIWLGAVGAGAAIIAASVVGVKVAADNGEKNEPPVPDPKETSQPVESTPAQGTETPENAYSVQDLLVPSATSPTEAAKIIIESRLTNWFSAGESGKANAEWVAAGGSNDFIEQKAASASDTFTEALFVPDWKNNPNLVKLEEFQEKANISAFEAWLRTYESGNPRDKEPYKRGMTLSDVSIAEQSGDSVTLNVRITEFDNSAKNRVVELSPNGYSPNGNKLQGEMKLKAVDGSWKIVSLDIHNAQ